MILTGLLIQKSEFSSVLSKEFAELLAIIGKWGTFATLPTRDDFLRSPYFFCQVFLRPAACLSFMTQVVICILECAGFIVTPYSCKGTH